MHGNSWQEAYQEQGKVCAGPDTRYQHPEHRRALARPGLHRRECVGGAAVNMHGLGEKREREPFKDNRIGQENLTLIFSFNYV